MNTNKLEAVMKKMVAEVLKEVEYHSTIWVTIPYTENMPGMCWKNAGVAYGMMSIFICRDFLELNLEAGYQEVVKAVLAHEIIHLKMQSIHHNDIKPHGHEFAMECVKYGYHPACWNNPHVSAWWRKESHNRVPNKKAKPIKFQVDP